MGKKSKKHQKLRGYHIWSGDETAALIAVCRSELAKGNKLLTTKDYGKKISDALARIYSIKIE